MIRTLTGMAAAAALLLGMAGSAMAQDVIKVGVAGPMTGQYAAFGAQMQAGAEKFVADINAAGGVLGKQLQLVVGDDACDPKQARSVAEKMVSEEIVFMAGHFCSGSSIPASEVYREEGIVQVSPASTNPKFTDEGGKGTYRVCGRDDQQGIVAGKFLVDNFPGKNVAFVHDKSAYGQGLAEESLKNFNANGGKEVLFEAITPGEKDYSALVAKLKDLRADVLYLGGYHTEGGLLVRQMREAGLQTVLMSGDALVTDEFWQITGDAGEGTLMTFSPDPRKSTDPAVIKLVEEFKAAGTEPEGYVLYTYAALQVFKEAAEKAGSTEFDALVGAMNANEFSTVLGNLRFDAKGDVTLPGYKLYVWKAGTYDYLN